MLKKISLLVLSFLSINMLHANSPKRPKLVVGIVLDQMRWDYLYRYADRYGAGGFKKLMKEGFNCENTSINYLPTYTAPGHAAIYTGSVPSLHGIAANDWIEKKDFSEMYCTQDNSVQTVGSKSDAGQMSPKNLLATTITDELKLATNFNAKTIGISLKDRGAILPAGHTANGAFWFDKSNGAFISSTFYGTTLPTWLEKFNARNITDSLLNIDWNTLYPINTYNQSSVDNNKYEGNLRGENSPTFPHQYQKFINSDKGVIRSSPWGNTITRMAAEAAVIGEQLGKGSYTDFLAVSFSSTDYIGHLYGPNAIEVEDCYLRMDKELEQFIKFLDKEIGIGNYTLFLTADHGGAHNYTFLQDNKIPSGDFVNNQVNAALNALLKTKFGIDSLIYATNYQIYVNEKRSQSKNISKSEILAICKNYLSQHEHVSFVLDMQNNSNNFAPKKIMDMAINGYNVKRSGDLQIILNPGYYSAYSSTGTTHGSWNPYDSRIPLLFYGWGIKQGSSFAPYNMTDIAPTLAALLKIQEPNACIGTPIIEVLK